MSFADMEAVVNAGCEALLANATLAYDNAGTPATVDCIFADSRNVAEVIGTPRSPREISAQIREVNLGGLVPGKAVAIRGVDYSVARIERDKTGWVTLQLRTA